MVAVWMGARPSDLDEQSPIGAQIWPPPDGYTIGVGRGWRGGRGGATREVGMGGSGLVEGGAHQRRWGGWAEHRRW